MKTISLSLIVVLLSTVYAWAQADGYGIDVADPQEKLDVNGAVRIGTTTNTNSGTIRWTGTDFEGYTGSQWESLTSGSGDDLGDHTATQNVQLNNNWISNDGGNEGIIIDNNGNVGIGVVATNAKLQISGGQNYSYSSYAYLNNVSSPVGRVNSPQNVPTSIFTDEEIVAPLFIALSDERLKSVIGVSNSSDDLNTLMQLQITDYTKIDVVKQGNTLQKKLIAQQVMSVYPQAVVSNLTQTIPDIYKVASINDGWITLADHELLAGDYIEIFNASGAELVEVKEVSGDKFRVSSSTTLAEESEVFVYGRLVNDLHGVDYEAISMLNVSATQELYKLLLEEKNKVNDLLTAFEKQEDRVDELESQVSTLLETYLMSTMK